MTTNRRAAWPPVGRQENEPRNRQPLQSPGPAAEFRSDPDRHRQPGEDPVLVVWGDQEARDDQLPHLQAGARRTVLRAHLRPGEGLRVLVRQVQAHEVQGRHLREVRRRGHARQGPARAHGPYRACRAGRAYLVPEVAAVPHRASARHDAQGPRARALFRELHRARAGADLAQAAPALVRGGLSQGAGGVRRGFASPPRSAPKRSASCSRASIWRRSPPISASRSPSRPPSSSRRSSPSG